MNVRILRVIGRRATAHKASVFAIVDEYRVQWDPQRDWTCDCDEDTYPECPHIPAVQALIDRRVYAEPTSRRVVNVP